jgi:hypothetical protein
MGTQPCRRVVVLAFFIVVTAFTVMRLDLNSKYNPNIVSTVWQTDNQLTLTKSPALRELRIRMPTNHPQICHFQRLLKLQTYQF